MLLRDAPTPEPHDQATARHAGVIGLGVAMPANAVSNGEIGALIGVDDHWIERRTGIRSRNHAPAGLSIVELAAASARAALADAALDAADLDLVIVATVSQETPMPNAAPQVAAAVGAVAAGAFDVGAACNGFLSALAVGAAFVESGRARKVLVIGADTLSRQTNPRDRSTAALFGDGAGAAILGATAAGGISAIELGSDGGAAQLIVTERESGFIRMDGHETFKQAIARMEQATRAVCLADGLDLNRDVDLFVFHQANARITKVLGERLALPAEKVVDCIAEFGNTSAASVPLALDHARRDGRLRAGSRVLLCAAGSGFVWGAALLDWGLR